MSLDTTQQQRAAALQAARAVLSARTAISTSAPDALDIVAVAYWIITGLDPWTHLLHGTGSSPASSSARQHDICECKGDPTA